MQNAESKMYRNYFEEIGIDEKDVEDRLQKVFQTFFYGSEEERIYHQAGSDMGYLEDTGNHDVRTEGMSYGMMICVQLDRKEEFDRIWKWAKTYMWMSTGENEGYFAWSCGTDGSKNSEGPAPDGEEYFAMALFFASHRWGDGEGIFCYSKEAKEILRACLHKGEKGRPGCPMWNRENYQILFVPGSTHTDPSYHLPHFYELFALWADEEDRAFWKKAAEVSREYLAKACHPVTGKCAEYAEFDGRPTSGSAVKEGERHDWFYSDAYRTAANIGLDYLWFGTDVGQCGAVERLLSFFAEKRPEEYGIYEIDGTEVHGTNMHGTKVHGTNVHGTRVPGRSLHPIGLLSANAQGALCTGTGTGAEWVKRFWETPLRQGERRYYDNCLYFFALLALSGNYRIW